MLVELVARHDVRRLAVDGRAEQVARLPSSERLRRGRRPSDAAEETASTIACRNDLSSAARTSVV